MEVIRFKVTTPYQSPYPEPIIFSKGERVKIGKEFTDDLAWKNWIWCKGKNNNKAWAPKQYIDINGGEGIFNRDYNALELSIEPGEMLTLFETINGFGMAVKESGEKGWVPLKNLSPVS